MLWTQPPLLGEIPAGRCCSPSRWDDGVCSEGSSPFCVWKSEQVFQEESNSAGSVCCCTLSVLYLSAPALPQWGRSAGYTLVSLSCSWGRTAISLDVSTFWSMKVKQILVVSEQEHLSCLLQESFWVVGRGHHRLWDTVRNQYPLSQNYCMMLPRAGPLEGREENHIEWKKRHLQIFLKLKIVRILSAEDSLSCYAAVIMWAGCTLLHLKTKTDMLKTGTFWKFCMPEI